MIRQVTGALTNNGGLAPGVTAPVNATLVSNVSTVNTPVDQAAPASRPAPTTLAILTVNASQPGAEIEVDGMFVGNAPSATQVAAGTHTLAVRHGAGVWQHEILLTPGGSQTINATPSRGSIQRASR